MSEIKSSPINDKKQKIKCLKEKGLKHLDMVNFKVENQISGGWRGPNQGRLILEGEGAPYIDIGRFGIVTINEGYDAYIGTIEKIQEERIFIKLSSDEILNNMLLKTYSLKGKHELSENEE